MYLERNRRARVAPRMHRPNLHRVGRQAVTDRAPGRSPLQEKPGNGSSHWLCRRPGPGPRPMCPYREQVGGSALRPGARMSRRYGLGQSIPATWRRRGTRRCGVPTRKECRAPARPTPDAPAPQSSSGEHDRRGRARAGEPPPPKPGAARLATALPHHAATFTVPFSIGIAPSAPWTGDRPGRHPRNDAFRVMSGVIALAEPSGPLRHLLRPRRDVRHPPEPLLVSIATLPAEQYVLQVGAGRASSVSKQRASRRCRS